MARSIVTFPAIAPALTPKHPLSVRPRRIVWVIVLIGWLAALGWNAEQISPLLLFFAPGPHPQGER